MKIIKTVRGILLSITFAALCVFVYSFYTVPDEICTAPNEEIEISSIYSLSLKQVEAKTENLKSMGTEGNYTVDVSIFNTIPVKSMNMRVSKRRYVVISGEIFGLRLFTKGVVIVSTSSVQTPDGEKNPAAKAGLKAGDVLIRVDEKEIVNCQQVIDLFSAVQNKTMTVVYVRDEKQYTTSLQLCCSTDGKYVGGLWIRDSAAGIGTMTFYDKNTSVYAGLGHGVCDADTGEILPLFQGDIVNACINGCYKGKSGEAGELCGSFSGGKFGNLCLNSKIGVYGFLDETDTNEPLTPVALGSEVKTGKAKVLSTVDDSGPQYYDAEIEKIDSADSEYRNLVIRITDKRLIEKTGGIVQGMSGSPIIQNGMLVGAVTHVFINDPHRGYGIFAEHMLTQAQTLSDSLAMAS